MREWPNGMASASQAEGCEFEPRHPLQQHKGGAFFQALPFFIAVLYSEAAALIRTHCGFYSVTASRLARALR